MIQKMSARRLSSAGLSRVQSGPGGILTVDEGGGGIEIRSDFVGGTGISVVDNTGNGAAVRSGNRAQALVFGFEQVAPDDTGEARIFANDGDGAQVGLFIVTKAGGVETDKNLRLGPAGDSPIIEILASGKLGFNGAAPVAVPVVPLTTPSVQNVIDALLALGLVTQSD